jgi:ParB family chromosome partitioning protein
MAQEKRKPTLTSLFRRRETEPFGKVAALPISRILPNPAQPRRDFDDEALLKLADSIRRHGILQPLTVRQADEVPRDDGTFGRKAEHLYELIAGERRLRAAKVAGLREVPCLICEASDRHSAELALVENLQREDLNPFEQAGAIASLIDLYGLTQEETGEILGISQSAVANKLRLLRLTAAERRILLTQGMSERHARALLKLSDPERRLAILRQAVAKSMNVMQLEALVDRELCPHESACHKDEKWHRGAVKDLRIVFNTLNRAVDAIEKAGIPVDSEKREAGDTVEFVVRIRKQGEPASASPYDNTEEAEGTVPSAPQGELLARSTP